MLAKSIPSEKVYAFATSLVLPETLKKFGLTNKTIEVFPKQASVLRTEKQCGNFLRLPGRHHRRVFWSEVWDGTGWLEGEKAVAATLAFDGDNPNLLPDLTPKGSATNKRGRAYPPKRVASSAELTHGAVLAPPRNDEARPDFAGLKPERQLVAATALDWASQGAGRSIEGQRGDDKLFEVAMTLHHDFGLEDDEFWTIFEWYNKNRCQPVWSEDRLVHKLSEAKKKGEGHEKPRGWKLDQAATANDPDSPGPMPSDPPEWPPAEKSPPYDIIENVLRKLVGMEEDPNSNSKTPKYEAICNFEAMITGDVMKETPSGVVREFEISASLPDGAAVVARVTTDDFPKMGWVLSQLGPDFIIPARKGANDDVRAAIQTVSKGHHRPRRSTTMLGWHCIEGEWLFAGAEGSIGAEGLRHDFAFDPPHRSTNLCRYTLGNPLAGPERLAEAARHAIALLGISRQPGIGAAILSFAVAAALGPVGGVLHAYGFTGTRKTSVCKLILGFFVAHHRAEEIFSTWSSSEAGLIDELCRAGVPLMMDDLINDVEGVDRKASAVFQAVGNGRAPTKARQDGTARPTPEIRATAISTGESHPGRASALGRSLILDFTYDVIIDLDRLSEAQRVVEDGLLADLTSAYLMDLAGNGKIEGAIRDSKLRQAHLRDEVAAQAVGCHSRAPELVGLLLARLKLWLDWLVARGLVDPQEAGDACQATRDGLISLLADQAAHQAQVDDGERFLELLRSGLQAKRAHLVGSEGGEPYRDQEQCGWERCKPCRPGEVTDFFSVGRESSQIGFVDNDEVWIDPQEALKVATSGASPGRMDRKLPDAKTLGMKLRARGMILTESEDRQGKLVERNTRQRRFRGVKGRYLCFRRDVFFGCDDSASDNLR